MTFKKEIEHYLAQICVLEETFRKVQDMDTLPLSFFSTSMDLLNHLKSGVYELESAQFQIMTQHLKESEEKLNADEEPIIKTDFPETEPSLETHGFLGDVIAKKIFADFSKSLSLNHRFMFQKDLFHGNADEMNQVLARLNAFHRIDDALNYLNENHSIRWEHDSGIAFRELLDKHFA
jgi:hypothetical protein